MRECALRPPRERVSGGCSRILTVELEARRLLVAFDQESSRGMISSGKLRRASWIPLVAAAVGLLAVDVHVSRAAARVERPANGDWIAYATAPASDQSRPGRYMGGSDIFIVQPGGTPKLVAGRGKGCTWKGCNWNVCPAFSPNGKLLAFGQKSARGPSIRVVGVSRGGTIVQRRIVRWVSKVRGASAPCPKWSADGKRIAYLDTNRDVVVMTIDGATRSRRAGDPGIADFTRNATTLVSPDGALIARREQDGGLVVSHRDGSEKFVVNERAAYGRGSYETAGWSPDSRTLLVMVDMDGTHFKMVALRVTPSNGGSLLLVAAPVVAGVEVNHARIQHARSWPGYGDVSWQPKP